MFQVSTSASADHSIEQSYVTVEGNIKTIHNKNTPKELNSALHKIFERILRDKNNVSYEAIERIYHARTSVKQEKRKNKNATKAT